MKPLNQLEEYHLHATYLYVGYLREGDSDDIAQVNAIFDARQLLNKSMIDKLTEKNPPIIGGASYVKLQNGGSICNGSYDKDIIKHVGETYYFQILLPVVKRAIQSGLSFVNIKSGYIESLNKYELVPIS